LLLAALVAGTIADVPNPRVSREIGGYHVLAADFHVHVFPFGWSALPPWDTVIEARHQGLDVVAITPHNGHLWLARVGRWFARVTGGPIVIVGEEIGSSRYHMLAVGIVDAVSSELSAADAIDEVHRQGGVAIAAHPYEQFQPAYDAEALQKLDGSEVVRPETQHDAQAAAQLREFFARAETTAIGASDYHSAGTRVGHSRTYVFALDRTEQAVLDAIREGRTVVYDRERAYGDPALIELAAASGGLPNVVPELPAPGALRVFSKVAAALALVVVLLLNRWSKPR
jgi:predicted metal-dependent phosphoesterase TrpH